jgi:hypothetical protein
VSSRRGRWLSDVSLLDQIQVQVDCTKTDFDAHSELTARVTVHLNSICDRFAPYDTVFSIANAKELKDNKLSAACSLHAASGSTSSSTSSLRRRRLMEIAEEEEEEQRAKRQSVVKEEDPSRLSAGDESPKPRQIDAPSSHITPTITLNSDLANAPGHEQLSGSMDLPTFKGGPRPPSPAKSMDAVRRNSSQSSRPMIESFSSYNYGKNKVRMGPRPSLDVSGRPSTAGGYRPISAIPAGFKLFSKSRQAQKAEKPKDEPSSSVDAVIAETKDEESSMTLSRNEQAHLEAMRPTTSSGASTKSAVPTVAKITPEKARLMRAMQLREKKKKAQDVPLPTIEIPSLETDQVDTLPSPNRTEPPPTIPEEAEQREDLLAYEQGASKRRSMSNADSAISIEGSNDLASVDTRTDSHPPSPHVASSEPGESTQASSLSESTDETVQPTRNAKVDETDETTDADQETTPAEMPGESVNTKVVSEVEGEHATLFVAVQDERPQARSNDEIALGSRDGHSVADRKLGASAMVEVTPQREIALTGATELQQDNEIGESSASVSLMEDTAVNGTAFQRQRPDLPISKFSSGSLQDLANQHKHFAADSGEAIPRVSFQEAEATSNSADAAGENKIGAEKQSMENTSTATAGEKRARRIALIEPIRTDIQHSRQSSANISVDDELLDELHSATLQEARPMTVSKSPMAPVFPNVERPTGIAGTGPNTPQIVRTVSNPVRGGLLTPGDVSQSSARTVSSGAAAFLHKITQQDSAQSLTPKQPGKIGSSISQRIKALEKLSSSATGGKDEAAAAAAASTRTSRPSTSFFSVRKTSGREPSKSPSVAERASSLVRGTTPSPPQTRESSPETARSAPRRERSGSMASRLSMFEPGNIPPMPQSRSDSIQVTARIVRDPNQPFPKAPRGRSDGSKDFGSLELKQSPLVVDHKKNPASAAQAVAPDPAVSYIANDASAPAPSPVIALGPGPEEMQAEADRKPKESLLQRRISRSTSRSQSQDRASQLSLPDVADGEDDDGEKRPRRRSSLSVVRDFIKDRRNSLRSAKSPSIDNLHIFSPPSAGASVTPSRGSSRPPSVHANFSLPSRLSIGSRRSSISRDTPLTGTLSPSLMSEVSPGLEDGSERRAKSRLGSPPEAHKNRTSRFIRRLSSSLGGSRKNTAPTISPTVTEEDAAEVAASAIPPSRGSTATYQPSLVAALGDVNVQFPDNLLWKRRTLCLDSHGFLVLSPVQGRAPGAVTPSPVGRDKNGGTVKRYHLSDFRPPYAPEVEVQELPNSVVLDFIDGGGLQIACGDRAGQANVLNSMHAHVCILTQLPPSHPS